MVLDSTTICKLVDLIPALRQSDCQILNWENSKTCLVIGFNHGLLGLAENPARGTGFWSQNTEGVARGVLTEKARPEGWVFSQAQQPMIKTYYSMSLHCNSAKLLYCSQTISDSRSKERESALDTVARQNRLLLRNGCLATYIIGKLFVHSMIWHNGC